MYRIGGTDPTGSCLFPPSPSRPGHTRRVGPIEGSGGRSSIDARSSRTNYDAMIESVPTFRMYKWSPSSRALFNVGSVREAAFSSAKSDTDKRPSPSAVCGAAYRRCFSTRLHIAVSRRTTVPHMRPGKAYIRTVLNIVASRQALAGVLLTLFLGTVVLPEAAAQIRFTPPPGANAIPSNTSPDREPRTSTESITSDSSAMFIAAEQRHRSLRPRLSVRVQELLPIPVAPPPLMPVTGLFTATGASSPTDRVRRDRLEPDVTIYGDNTARSSSASDPPE